MPLQLLHSASLSPVQNIAFEESFLEQNDGESKLLFWQSRSAVVLGKNQNPWMETNLGYCREYGIDVARRFSGGGCVYQDMGNLNYALIRPRNGYSMEQILDHLAKSFREQGIPAERILENALGVSGLKFSGHAFCYRRDCVLHHGTLLIQANLGHLRNSLLPTEFRLNSHAVPSRPASVTNLSDFGLDLEQTRQLVIRGLESALNDSVTEEIKLQPGDMQELARTEKFASREWVWGQTPAFTLKDQREQSSLRFQIRRMRVEAVEGLSGAAALEGCSLLNGEVEGVLENLDPATGQLCRDLLSPFYGLSDFGSENDPGLGSEA